MGPPSSSSFDHDSSAPPYPIAPHPHHVPSALPPPPSHHFLAAQNLTFMKHGSPVAAEEKKKAQNKTFDHGDIPSLASSSEGTSPGAEPTFIKPPPSRDATRTDALLMAAVAMTEFDRSLPTNGKRNAAERLEDTKRTKIDESTREKSLSKGPKGKK